MESDLTLNSEMNADEEHMSTINADEENMSSIKKSSEEDKILERGSSDREDGETTSSLQRESVEENSSISGELEEDQFEQVSLKDQEIQLPEEGGLVETMRDENVLKKQSINPQLSSVSSSLSEIGRDMMSPMESRSEFVIPDASPELMHIIDSAIQEWGNVNRLRRVVLGEEKLGNDMEENVPEVAVDVLLMKMGGVEGHDDSAYSSAPTVMLSTGAAIVAAELIPCLPCENDRKGFMSCRTRLVKGLLRVLKSCTRNRSMCSAAGLMRVLISSAEKIFTGSCEQRWDPSPLYACLEVLAAHSLTVLDLRDWLDVVTKAIHSGRAQRLLFTLERAMLGTETKGPSHTFEFDGESSGLLGPGETRWPFSNGYSFVTWLYVESFADTLNAATAAAAIAAAAAAKSGKSSAMSAAAAASALAGEGTAHMPRLFSFLSSDNQGIEAYFHGQFLVVECGNGKGKKASLHFTHAFKPRCWYFIGLEHVNKQGMLGKSESELKLYIDGQLFESRPFEFPRITKPLAFCCIGTNPPPTIAGLQRRRRQCPLFAEMGPVYIFKEPLGAERMLCLAYRGGDAVPTFGNGSGQPSFATNEHARALADESLALDLEIETRIHLLYHPKLLVGRSCPDASPSGQSGVHRKPAEILGHVHVAGRIRPVETLWAIAEGGVLSLLPLTVSSVDKQTLEPVISEEQRSFVTSLLSASIFRMISIAVRHPGSSEELSRTQAPEIIAKLLHYLLEVLSHDLSGAGKSEEQDEELVAAVIMLCQSPQSNFGLKVKLFSNLLLDLKLWSRCSYGLQKKLLSSLADMAFTEASCMRAANAVQVLLDGCRRCYWLVREKNSIETSVAGKPGCAAGEVNALVDELLVIVELLVGYSTTPMAVNDVQCLIRFLLDCPQPNQVSRILHLIYRLVVQPNTTRANMFAETFMSCGGIEMLIFLLQREAEAGDHSQISGTGNTSEKLTVDKIDQKEANPCISEENDENHDERNINGRTDASDTDNVDKKANLSSTNFHGRARVPSRKLSGGESLAARKIGGISFSINPENARNSSYNVDNGDGILVGIIRLVGALVSGGQLKFSAQTLSSPRSAGGYTGTSHPEDDDVTLTFKNQFILFSLQKAFQAAPHRLMTDTVYAALLGAVINISTSDDNLNLYDAGKRFEHIQLFLVLLRSLPHAPKSLQIRAIQDILFLACSNPENRTILTSMTEWPEWLLEVLITNYEMAKDDVKDDNDVAEVEDLVHNFLAIMLEHSMRQKDGWKDVEAALHCSEWLALIGGSSTGEKRIRREESLPLFKRRLLGGLMEFAARELKDQTHVIAAVAAGVAAGGLSPQLARAEAESATYLSMALAENAIVILMFVEDHLRFQCQLFNASKSVSGTGSPVSSVFSFGGRSLSLEKDGGENVIYRRASSSSSDAGGLPLDVLASMADANGQISAASMERLTAAAAAEPYESVRCAFVSYGSCASDLASGWKCRSRMWYGVGLPLNPGNFSGGGSGFEKWSTELEKDDNGDWVEIPLIQKSIAMLEALLLDESGLGSGLAVGGGSGTGMGGMGALQQLLDSDQPFLTMVRMVLVSMREEDRGEGSCLLNSISMRDKASEGGRTGKRKPRSALLWSVLNPVLTMPASESRRQRVLVSASILYSEVWHAFGSDRKPIRKQYLEAILPPFVALLRRWRPLLCGIHDLTDPDGMNPLAIDERVLAADALPIEAALAMITPGWASAFASPPAAMALAMAAAGAGGADILPPKGSHLRREGSLLDRRASKLRSFPTLQKAPDSPEKSSPLAKDNASAKSAALAAARDQERNAKIGSGRGLSAVAMATSAQRRNISDRERVNRWNIYEAMGTAWLECLQLHDESNILEKDYTGLVLKYVRVLISMIDVAKHFKKTEIDRLICVAASDEYHMNVGSCAWRRLIHCLIEHDALFGPLKYEIGQFEHVFWKLDFSENSLRMRRRLKRNYKGKPHIGAAADYDDSKNKTDNSSEQTDDSESKTKIPLSNALSANATFLPPQQELLDGKHEEGACEIYEERNDGEVGNIMYSPNKSESIDEEPFDASLLENDSESPVHSVSRVGIVAIEPDERMILEIPAVMVEPLRLMKGRFQVTSKRLNFILDDTVDVGDTYIDDNGNSVDSRLGVKDHSWFISVLCEVYSRRYLLRRSALELFMTDKSNFFFDFGTAECRRKAYKAIVQAKPLYLNSLYYSTQNPEQLLKRTQLMERWARWEISNFEYLMQLNTIAGRSYNDITQYPVFPWVLADYTSDTLNFSDPSIYRDLSKPVGALNPERLEKFLERYSNFDDPVIPKFHYGSHYSSAGTVLYYLTRVEPFTTLAIQLQGGKFDHADRMFSDIMATWNSVLEDMSDVKELVPELFYLPEVLTNENAIDLGTTQLGEKIDNVKLPPWARNPIDFVHKHRMALESEYVSEHLHEWIDLIFGYKQRGKEAVVSNNVFFYMTYEGAIDIDKITDPALRRATQDQIAYFGQTPSQLLTFPHVKRRPLADVLHLQTIFRNPTDIKPYEVASSDRCNVPASAIYASTDAIVTVDRNLPAAHVALHRWQPNTPDGHGMPFLFHHGKATLTSGSGSFMRMFKTQANLGSDVWEYPRAIALPALGIQNTFNVGVTPDLHVITGGHADNSVKLISSDTAKTLETAAGHCAPVTCLAISPDGSTLVTGSRDTTAIIWRLHVTTDKTSHNRAGNATSSLPNTGVGGTNESVESRKRYIEGPLHVLRGHVGEITCCCINADLDLVVTCSCFGTVLLHSISKGRLLRCLPVSHGADIVSLSSEGMIVVWDKTLKQLETFTVNGFPVSKRKLFSFHGDITCIEISQDGKNAIFGTSTQSSVLEGNVAEKRRQNNTTRQAERIHTLCSEDDDISSISVPSVCLLDLHTLKVLNILELHEGQDVTALALNKDNTNLVVSLLDKHLLIYTDPALSVKVVDQMLRLGWQGDGLAPLIKH